MHIHHCAHVLLYCSSCDVAYCSKCSREWGKYTNCQPYFNTTTSQPNIFTVNDTTSATTIGHTRGNHAG